MVFRTIRDMEDYFYGKESGYIQKTDAPVISTTAGFYNPFYSAKVWSQLNQEANIVGIMPKKPFDRTGWRVKTARAAASGGGYTENAVLPETIKPTVGVVSAKPKTVVHKFLVSELEQIIADSDDGISDTMQWMREELGIHHAEMMNVMLCNDVDTATNKATDLSGIDLVISSYDEVATGGLDANDADVYGLDRDAAASFADSVVIHNGETIRALELTHMNSLFQQIWDNGGKPKVLATGNDTLTEVSNLLQPQQRFMNASKVQPSYNGVQVVEAGFEGGFIVPVYNGIPMITSKDVKKAASGKSQLYAMDTDTFFMMIAKPTQYYEAGVSKNDPFVVNALSDMGLYRTVAETRCLFFKGQGKIKDIA